MKNLFISHNDLDGAGCSLVLELSTLANRFHSKLNLNYNDLENPTKLSFISQFDLVYVTDFSLKPEFLVKMLSINNNKRVIIFDHHESAFEGLNALTQQPELKDRFKYVYDLHKSGTEIFFDWMREKGVIDPNILSRLEPWVRIIGTYDLYKKDSELWDLADKINKLYWYTIRLDWDNGINLWVDQIKQRVLTKSEFLTEKDLEILNRIELNNNKDYEEFMIQKGKLTKTSKGNPVLLVLIPRGGIAISELADRYLAEHPEIAYVVFIKNSKMVSPFTALSVRCRSPYTVYQLKGVQGHKEAGGGVFSDPSYLKDVWDGKILLEEI